MIGYHWLHVKAKAFGPVKGVQLDGPAPHEFWEAVDGGCFRLATTGVASPSPAKKVKGAAGRRAPGSVERARTMSCRVAGG